MVVGYRCGGSLVAAQNFPFRRSAHHGSIAMSPLSKQFSTILASTFIAAATCELKGWLSGFKDVLREVAFLVGEARNVSPNALADI